MPISRTFPPAALALCLALGALPACSGSKSRPVPTPAQPPVREAPAAGDEVHPAVGSTARGLAAWYGKPHHGKPTADGGRFNMNAYTAAHRTLPFGTVVRVTNLRNNRSVNVRITDRGPYTKRFIIDVSRRAAMDLDMIRSGTASVLIEIVSIPKKHKGAVSI